MPRKSQSADSSQPDPPSPSKARSARLPRLKSGSGVSAAPRPAILLAWEEGNMYESWDKQVVLRLRDDDVLEMHARAKDGGRWVTECASEVEPQPIHDASTLYAALVSFLEAEGETRDNFERSTVIRAVRRFSRSLATELEQVFTMLDQHPELLNDTPADELVDAIDELLAPADAGKTGMDVTRRTRRRKVAKKREKAFRKELERIFDVAEQAEMPGAFGGALAVTLGDSVRRAPAETADEAPTRDRA